MGRGVSGLNEDEAGGRVVDHHRNEGQLTPKVNRTDFMVVSVEKNAAISITTPSIGECSGTGWWSAKRADSVSEVVHDEVKTRKSGEITKLSFYVTMGRLDEDFHIAELV